MFHIETKQQIQSASVFSFLHYIEYLRGMLPSYLIDKTPRGSMIIDFCLFGCFTPTELKLYVTNKIRIGGKILWI